MWIKILISCCLLATAHSKCQENNVALDGDTQSTSNARTADDCQKECDKTRCAHWTWKGGQCKILRTANPGKKVGVLGAVSGTKNSTSCPSQIYGVECYYEQTRDPVICLFPFFGEVPGSRDASRKHETCLKTKRGIFWCATKVSIDNKLLAPSDQTKHIECGLATSNQGDFRCIGNSSCPSITSVKRRIADLEQKNRELEARLAAGGCTSSGSTGTSGWGAWSPWTQCSKTCAGTQTRSRTCPQNAKCQGSATESRNCGGPCTGASGASSTGTKINANSCAGRCEKTAGIGQCQCTASCVSFGDCCSDYAAVCGAKVPSGGTPRPTSRPAQTNIRAPATSADPVLGPFTESLLALDENNAMDKITLNVGCNTRVGKPNDCSSAPLFTRVDTSIFRKPVYTKLMAMYENYIPDTLKVEDNTRPEQAEEQAFVDEIMKTKVMMETLAFLSKNKYFTKSEADFKRLLKELWFGVYSRGMRIKGSSGFEHVFLGEKKAGKVQGFHNWVYFYFLEKQNQVNYLGHWENVDLGSRGVGLSFTFKWGQEQKPFASFMVGTSPELELAIYTTCLLAKGEDKCRISLGGKPVEVEIHVFTRPGGVRYIASSFMDWN